MSGGSEGPVGDGTGGDGPEGDGAEGDGTRGDGAEGEDDLPGCSSAGCESAASFYLYELDGGWRPICTVHARQRHPSLEVHAWLESGYLKPVELGRPETPPGEPPTGRAEAFRSEVEGTMGWDG